MSVHAFVDESGRDSSYIVCVSIVDPAQLGPARRQLSSLLLPGQRELHFKKEKPRRRRLLADRIAALPTTSWIYATSCTPKTAEQDRQRCLAEAVRDLLAIGARRVVIDSRQEQDRHDEATIYEGLGGRPSETGVVYEHHESTSTPLLWIPDAVAWCYGAGGDWRRRIESAVAKVAKV
ncbi:hypothetical protein [Amycolatopsis pithecellobii]|uniref:DUF3800 domain-containing protein n=1 Tax=Amycolatopsis pithecellobii TaxID=664692 RepID=A0A6N7Z443_9PSEU|nr:hypothetical protein [Amycolatopsis pithecellobii]MTD55004.1 hypothetical protein [Amycolatopsis pithecellobii]